MSLGQNALLPMDSSIGLGNCLLNYVHLKLLSDWIERFDNAYTLRSPGMGPDTETEIQARPVSMEPMVIWVLSLTNDII